MYVQKLIASLKHRNGDNICFVLPLLISSLPKIILLFIQLSCYFHEKRFEVLCQRMSDWRLLKKMGHRWCAIFWRNTLWWKEQKIKREKRKRRMFTFKHKSDSMASHFKIKKTSLNNREIDFFIQLLGMNIAINRMCIQSK